MTRPYIAESVIPPGTAVVRGSADNKVKSPADGTGSFIGIYAFEANEKKAAGDPVGIALAGMKKVLAGGTVTAGGKAVMADGGSLINIPAAAGRYDTCGTFLESGVAGEYVDLLIEHGSVTIPETE
jgi:hypothetical protein